MSKGIPTGLGEPFFDSVEVCYLIFCSLFRQLRGLSWRRLGSTRMPGSQNNDMIVDGEGSTLTNNAGGINGGISNGNEIVVRVAVKPTPSIATKQMTYNRESGEVEELVIKGRHDACIALRAGVVIEAAVAIGLTDLMLCAQRVEVRKGDR